MSKIVFKLLTARSLGSHKDGHLILNLWKKHLPGLLPDRIGNYEPIREKFDPDNLEAALALWQDPFLAVKKKPKMYSSVWMRMGPWPPRASWLIKADCNSVNQEALCNLLREAPNALEADFACAHFMNAPEIERGLVNGTVSFVSKRGEEAFKLERRVLEFAFLLSSQELERCIPELYWATVFGPPYVEMFGRERLLSAPAYKVEALGPDRVLVQLSERLDDLEKRWDEVEKVRIAVKNHLGADAFFQPDADSSFRYRVPEFKF